MGTLKQRAAKLKEELTAVYYAYRDPQLKRLPKVILFITLAYALSPIDLIPDFIPVLGYLDDLIILPALIALSLRLIPGEVMAAARARAAGEPLRLKENWLFAVVFILIWATLAAAVLYKLIEVIMK